MAPWPYATISPAMLDTLTAEDRVALEAVTLAFIEAMTARRGVKPRGRKN